jgi:hypothetical protein
VDSDFESVRSKLSGLLGTPLEESDVLKLLAEIVAGGGGVYVEVDDTTRFRLIRRDGKFVVVRDQGRSRLSSFPPRR